MSSCRAKLLVVWLAGVMASSRRWCSGRHSRKRWGKTKSHDNYVIFSGVLLSFQRVWYRNMSRNMLSRRGLWWSFGCLVTHANQRTMAAAQMMQPVHSRKREANPKFGTTISTFIMERMERIKCNRCNSVKLSPLRWWSVGCQGRAPCIISGRQRPGFGSCELHR